jgi:hypothetical protein
LSDDLFLFMGERRAEARSASINQTGRSQR